MYAYIVSIPKTQSGILFNYIILYKLRCTDFRENLSFEGKCVVGIKYNSIGIVNVTNLFIYSFRNKNPIRKSV